MKVSKRIFNLETETAFAVLAKANKLKLEGKDIINLGIGQPDFPTPSNIVEAGIKALRDGKHGYTASKGLIELREAVTEEIYNSYKVNINPENILITPGGKPTIFFSIIIFGNENNEFRVSELSNYFSAVVAYGNQENEQALKYFKSSKK